MSGYEVKYWRLQINVTGGKNICQNCTASGQERYSNHREWLFQRKTASKELNVRTQLVQLAPLIECLVLPILLQTVRSRFQGEPGCFVLFQVTETIEV